MMTEVEKKLLADHHATLVRLNEMYTKHLKLQDEHIALLDQYNSRLKEIIGLHKRLKKAPHAFPDTPSFVCGTVMAYAMSSAISGHADWWVWALASIPCIIYAAWKSTPDWEKKDGNKKST